MILMVVTQWIYHPRAECFPWNVFASFLVKRVPQFPRIKLKNCASRFVTKTALILQNKTLWYLFYNILFEYIGYFGIIINQRTKSAPKLNGWKFNPFNAPKRPELLLIFLLLLKWLEMLSNSFILISTRRKLAKAVI